MMTREQLFEHLMQNDADFRKEIVSAATVAGMELYQAALSMLDKDEKNDTVAEASRQVIDAKAADKLRSKNPSSSAKAKAAKARGKRQRAESPEQRSKRLKVNEKIRNAVVKLLTDHGPLTIAELKAKMHPKTAGLINNRQHMHNAMYFLKQEKQIRWTRGSKRPNVKWETVK